MENKYFAELARRLRAAGITAGHPEKNRLTVLLNNQPVLSVSAGSDVFLLPAGSNQPEAGELYHKVAQTADEVYAYVEAVQTAPLLHASGLSEKFHLLADFGGAVLAGRELENGWGYQFVTWIWDHDRTGVSHGHYGYQTAILDLRNPTRSDGNNLLHLINKYMDIYKAEPDNLAAKAKAEKYAKILAKTLINTSGGDSAQYGQNAFFYDSAEGLLTAMFLLVAEYLPTEDEEGNPVEKRHIVSVFKLVQELLAPSRVKRKNQFQLLLDKLPPNHKAKWFAGSALNTAEQAMASVLSTVLSRLNAFLDSEMEQILCFDTAVDAEKFCNEKSAIFVVLPEEDTTKYFMVSLIIQNLYREILTVADENGGRLKNRVVFFADELGSCPPIQSLELMFSASRSRGLMLVPIVQSITGQLQKNYGKEGSEIIVDNCQVNIFGGFAPASQTAEELSKALGSRTVMSGSISRGKNDPSQSLQMMERPLMTPDELKSMPKGSFIVAKTGVHPMRVRLRLFLDWGIRFGEPYEVPEKAQRPVAYADKQELEEAIIRRHYASSIEDEENQVDQGAAAAGGLSQGMRPEANRRKPALRP